MIQQRLNLRILMIVRNTNNGRPRLLDHGHQRLQPPTISSADAVHLVHQDYGFSCDVAAEGLDEFVLEISFLPFLTFLSPIINTLVTR